MRRQQAMQEYYAPKKSAPKFRPSLANSGAKNVITVKQGDTLPSLAAQAGVTEKDIVDLGVKQPIPGQVLDLTSASRQKAVATQYASFKQLEGIDQQLYAIDQEKLPTGPRSAGARLDQQKRRNALLAERNKLTQQAQQPQTPEDLRPQVLETPISQLKGFFNIGQTQEMVNGKLVTTQPEKEYFLGKSPADEAAWIERQQLAQLQQRWQELYPNANPEAQPITSPYEMSASPTYAGKQPGAEYNMPSEMAQEGGRWIRDGLGNYIWQGNPGTPPTDFQRVVDSQAASLSMRAIDFAIANEMWDRLPTSISPGASAMLIGHTILLGGDKNQPLTLDLETLSMLGYSMNDAGALIHEEVDTEVPFSAGYGDYTGGYGGGGGGGGSDKWRSYAGGNASDPSGRFSKQGGNRYQHLGVGTANWRI